MTTADNLNRIIQAKADIKTAIENKGVAVGDITIDGYANKIGEIPQGDVSFSGLDFSVIGYDMALTRELNDEFNADIQYSLQKYNEWNPNRNDTRSLYQWDEKLIYAPLIDTSKVDDMYSMYQWCSNLKTVPLLNTSKVKNMYNLFYGCKKLTTVPLFDTSEVTNAGAIFEKCENLTTVPLFDFSNAISMSRIFSGCKNLTTVPQFNTSKVTDAERMFDGCANLTTVPQFDTQNVTNMSYMFQDCTALESLPLFDFSNVTTIKYYFGYSDLNNLTTLGGFKDLKIDWSDKYGLAKCPNLSYESVMNVINNLYDFRGNGDETTTKTIKFHANSLALLSDDDKAIATNRGWVLS